MSRLVLPSLACCSSVSLSGCASVHVVPFVLSTLLALTYSLGLDAISASVSSFMSTSLSEDSPLRPLWPFPVESRKLPGRSAALMGFHCGMLKGNCQPKKDIVGACGGAWRKLDENTMVLLVQTGVVGTNQRSRMCSAGDTWRFEDAGAYVIRLECSVKERCERPAGGEPATEGSLGAMSSVTLAQPPNTNKQVSS